MRIQLLSSNNKVTVADKQGSFVICPRPATHGKKDTNAPFTLCVLSTEGEAICELCDTTFADERTALEAMKNNVLTIADGLEELGQRCIDAGLARVAI